MSTLRTSIRHPIHSVDNQPRVNHLVATHQRLTGASWVLPLLLFLAFPTLAPAQFTFTTNADNTITITGYKGSSAIVVIPSATNGYPVTVIGDNAFLNNSHMSQVSIPDGVTTIGKYAFSTCPALTSITIPTNVTSVGSGVFSYSTSLTNITFPAGITNIPTGSFYYCRGLMAITVDPLNSVYNSENGILFDWNHTTLIQYPPRKPGASYTIPNSVTNIGNYALQYATNLTSITIPKTIISIGDLAFDTCTGLTEISIPDGVIIIGRTAFTYCPRLVSISVDPLNPAFRSVGGDLFNNPPTRLIQCPGGRSGSYVVPNFVTEVGDYAFESCTSLANIIIPNTVTNVGIYVFKDCTALASVAFPDSIAAINRGSFSSCSALTNVIIPDGIASIGVDAFYGCSKMAILTLPKSITNIQDWAFYGCSGLWSLYFAGDAPTIGSNVFYNLNYLTLYYLPGTSGWGPTFAGRTAILWNPQVQTNDPSFGVRTNRFGFNITGTPYITFVVEASSGLPGGTWTPVQTFYLTNASVYFADPAWTNYPSRLYRIRSP